MPLSIDTWASVGKIVTNLLSLEFALRVLLYKLQRASGIPMGEPLEFWNRSVGEWVPETPLTNYDTLAQVMKKANSELQARGLSNRVDESLVKLRDALAHGRVLAKDQGGPFRIFKFSEPRGPRVKVVVSVEMTPDWLDQQVKRTAAEVRNVMQVGRTLGLNCFPDT